MFCFFIIAISKHPYLFFVLLKGIKEIKNPRQLAGVFLVIGRTPDGEDGLRGDSRGRVIGRAVKDLG